MKFVNLTLLLFFNLVFLGAQETVPYGEPVSFITGECGTLPHAAPPVEDLYNMIIEVEEFNSYGIQPAFIGSECCNFEASFSYLFFPGSLDYEPFIEAPQSESDSPSYFFFKSEGLGDTPNLDLSVSKKNAEGENVWSVGLPLPENDYGIKTIGTSDGGALTIAVKEDAASGLFQLRFVKHEPIAGGVEWQTFLPISETGYDIIFQGVDENGEFVYETNPEPVISLVKEVADGYLIVNPNKEYNPPVQTRQFTNFIKLDLDGNVLWTNNFSIPWRELEIGPGSSADIGFRGRVTSVEGTEDGNTYFTFSASGDINPDAQYRKLNNAGEIVESFSKSWISNDNYSWLVKEINGRIYWLVHTETFDNANQPPAFNNNFVVVDITEGLDNPSSIFQNIVAVLPNPAGGYALPKDLIQLPNGDFLVSGAQYPSENFPESIPFNNPASVPFLARLENNSLISGTDLSLSVSADNVNTGIYDYVTLTYTLNNEGNTPATGVELSVQRTSQSVLSGEFPATASQGNFSLGYLEDALWTVGTLNAGETATLELTYFTLAANTSYFAEVSSMNETDTDSSPDNGNFGEENEDDEATIDIGTSPGTISGTVFFDSMREGGVNCQSGNCTFLEGIELKLYIQGTSALVATAVTNAQGQYIFPSVQPGAYTLEYEIQDDYLVTPYFNGPPSFQFANNFVPSPPAGNPYIGISINSNSSNVVRNLGLVDGNECTLEALYAETDCDDNGTPNNLNDDTFTITFRADGLGVGQYSLNNSGGSVQSGSFIYANGFVTIGPFAAGIAPATLTINNRGTFTSVDCEEVFSINTINDCSTGSNLPDLEVINSGPLDILQLQAGQQNIVLIATNIINTGPVPTPAGELIPLSIFLSSDTNFGNADDVLLEFVQYQQLQTGAFQEVVNFDIPSSTVPGDYRIYVEADSGNNIAESDESNNLYFREVTISEGNGECSITFSQTGYSGCLDNDTPNDANDDFFIFNFTPTLFFGSGEYSVDVPIINNDGSLSYTTVTQADGTPISFSYNILEAQAAFGDFINLVFSDAADPDCNSPFNVGVPDVCSLTGTGEVDLELSTSDQTPGLYQNGQAVFTLTNTGSEEATGIILEFNKNATVSITSFPTASQGSPQQHWTDAPRWNVGSLGAGQSATITFDIFSLAEEINFYGEVIAQNENDIDSNPDNGNGVAPIEDDEATYPGGGTLTIPCTSVSATVTNLLCNNQGTDNNPDDDTFTFDLSVSSNGNECSDFNLSSPAWNIQGQLGTTLNSPEFDIANGEISFDVNIAGSPGVNAGFTVSPPSTCSNGSNNLPDLTLSNLSIDGQGTPGAVTDYTVQVSNIGTADVQGDYVVGAYLSSNTVLDANDPLVGVINTGNTPVGNEPLTPASITVPANTPAGDYFLILETDTNQSIAESNENNNQVSGSFTVISNDGGSGVDLVVNIQTASTTVGQYQNVSINYNLINTGDSPATGVQVFVPQPTGVVYVGGNEYSTSQGTFEVFGSNIWNVGTVSPGQNLTLTVNYFTLNEGQLVLWQEVAGLNESDTDSTPGNGTPFQSFSEDDEARLLVTVSNSIAQNSFASALSEEDQLAAKLYPVPVRNSLSIEIYLPEAEAGELRLLNNQGGILHQRELSPEKGKQQVNISMANEAPGVYFLQIMNAKEMRTYRFVRL